MVENEVIVVNGIPDDDYESLINDCVKYAIISSPFTVDRMDIPDVKRRILNIAKGKVAEHLFKYFCEKNSIHPDFDSCETPFWTVDQRDFMLGGFEWDIKNNFIYHSGEALNGRYTELPALVPNRFSGDQWSKRNTVYHQEIDSPRFLFTFLQGAPLINGDRGAEFLEINLSIEQKMFLDSLYSKYEGQPQNKPPYDENEFWNTMKSRGNEDYFTLKFKPYLVITAYADSSNWSLFKDTSGKYSRFSSFLDEIPGWYRIYKSGSLSFLNGTLWTKITNATCPICRLNSFLSLFPKLRTNINNAIILTD